MTFARARMVNPLRFSGAKVYKSADQVNITDGAVLVTFDTVLFDTDSYFDNTNDRLVPPTTGYYLASGGIYLYQGTLVQTAVQLQKNTTNIAHSQLQETDGTGAMPLGWVALNVSTPIQLTTSDTVRLQVNVDSDGANNIDIRGGNDWTTWLSLVRIGQTP